MRQTTYLKDFSIMVNSTWAIYRKNTWTTKIAWHAQVDVHFTKSGFTILSLGYVTETLVK